MESNNQSNQNEIFIRNIGFNTTEDKLKEFICGFVPEKDIEFCLIVKDKETNNSKGTAFVKFKNNTSYNKIMSIYNDNTSNTKHNDMNLFELDGRNLKLFPAVSRDEIKEIKTSSAKKDTKRKKDNLYLGLSNESIEQCELFVDITDTDKLKREKLIEIKKKNFYANPNYHVSNTRLSIRNFDKKINETHFKQIINETIQKNKSLCKQFKNVKIIKQIKLLKDKIEEKSKCVAFVECCDFIVAKYLIEKLSGYKMTPTTKKGLIIDLSLDDARKRNKREKKLKLIKQARKERIKQLHETTKQNENSNQKVNIGECNDINVLIDYYHMTLSRGKKQRIKKKLKALGYTDNIPPLQVKQDVEKEINEDTNEDKYVQIKVSNDKTELNKKFKEKRKGNQKGNDEEKVIGKKRNRSVKKNDKAKSYYSNEDASKKNKKKNKRLEREGKLIKKHIKEQYNDEYDDDDLNMDGYYKQIMKNLNKKK